MTLAHQLRTAAAVALATASTAAIAPPAGAQTAPVSITSCTILQATRTAYPFWYPFGPPPIPRRSPFADGIRIVYVNHGPLAANRVAFQVNYRGDIQRIVDVGTFSPAATIDHTFGNFSGDAFLGSSPNTCVVRAVRFVNGSIWRQAPL